MSMFGAKIHDIDLDLIERSSFQSRKTFEENSIQELAESIKLHGLIQPIVVRACGKQKYELIAGERRWRAAQLVKLNSLPAIVRNINDEQACQLNTVENIQRVDLNPIEEGSAYQRLIDDFNYTHEEVGQAVGKSRTKITNLLRLLNLPDCIQQAIAERKLSESQGKLLSGLPEKQQMKLFQQCSTRSWSQRQLEAAIQAAKHANMKPKATQEDHDMRLLERDLSALLGCKTQIDFAQGAGQLHIHFHDVDVLQGVLQKLGYCQEA
jgi:ParB family transcriptional regulator, chromosome partitioning protein